MTRIPRWRAVDDSRVAHAYPSRREPAYCGKPNGEERYDWPKKRHCLVCMTATAALLAAQQAGPV